MQDSYLIFRLLYNTFELESLSEKQNKITAVAEFSVAMKCFSVGKCVCFSICVYGWKISSNFGADFRS